MHPNAIDHHLSDHPGECDHSCLTIIAKSKLRNLSQPVPFEGVVSFVFSFNLLSCCCKNDDGTTSTPLIHPTTYDFNWFWNFIIYSSTLLGSPVCKQQIQGTAAAHKQRSDHWSWRDPFGPSHLSSACSQLADFGHDLDMIWPWCFTIWYSLQ